VRRLDDEIGLTELPSSRKLRQRRLRCWIAFGRALFRPLLEQRNLIVA